MILLKIYIGFCLIAFFIVEFGMYEIKQLIKAKYAEKISKNQNKQNQKFLRKLCIHIKMLIACFVPGVNFILFCAVLYNSVNVKEDTLDKHLKKRGKSKTNATELRRHCF